MSSNSSSIVISFSIAILLLLTLLLLISYNSKCKMDNIERFENDNEIQHFQSQLTSEILQHAGGQSSSSVASKSSVDLNKASNPTLGTINASEANNGYTSTSGEYVPNSGNNGNIGGDTFVGNTDVDSSSDSCFVRDRLTSSDLLPKDAANSKWAQINPAGSGILGDQNFLTAGYHVGINTIGQSLRNANLQLRSEPPNPQVAVSPWGISTIEPDVRAVAFEIGSAASF
jgi:hypothetical protein